MNAIALPADGDVLVTRPTASREHRIAIVPGQPYAVFATRREALEAACRTARERRVNAWLCEDHRSFLLIACYGDQTRIHEPGVSVPGGASMSGS